MNKVYIIVNETDRSNGAFSTPTKAVAWYYSHELKASGNNTIDMEDGRILTLEEVTASMLDRHSDYPCIDTLIIDGPKVSLIDS